MFDCHKLYGACIKQIVYGITDAKFMCSSLKREGGLLLKENFEGGATWAFQVGSQSITCPIIAEDLNLPRQILVEVKVNFVFL